VNQIPAFAAYKLFDVSKGLFQSSPVSWNLAFIKFPVYVNGEYTLKIT
jgi:hypothetical protein